MWRECLKKVWEVAPLTCPHCAAEMKLISFIYKKTVIKKILTHLDLHDEQKNQRSPPVMVEEYTESVEIVPFDDGWLEYKGPFVERK